jgi:hypothetical protein
VNGPTYRQKEKVGWVVCPSIRGRERSNDSEKTHHSTRALSCCGPVDPWEENALVTRRKHINSAYGSHSNKTHVT